METKSQDGEEDDGVNEKVAKNKKVAGRNLLLEATKVHVFFLQKDGLISSAIMEGCNHVIPCFVSRLSGDWTTISGCFGGRECTIASILWMDRQELVDGQGPRYLQ